MQTSQNQQIIEGLKKTFEQIPGLPTSEDILSFIETYVMEALEAKDSERREAVRAVVESLAIEKRTTYLTMEELKGAIALDTLKIQHANERGYNQKVEEDQQWKADHLGKLN